MWGSDISDDTAWPAPEAPSNWGSEPVDFPQTFSPHLLQDLAFESLMFYYRRFVRTKTDTSASIFERIVLASNYLWNGNDSRKNTVTSFADLTPVEKERVARIVPVVCRPWIHFSNQTKPVNVLYVCLFMSPLTKIPLNRYLYQYGSRVWGSNDALSDWDFVLVCKDLATESSYMENTRLGVNVTVVLQSIFQVKNPRPDHAKINMLYTQL